MCPSDRRYAILQWCLRSLLHPRCSRRTNRSSTSLVSNGYTGECHLQGILPWKLQHLPLQKWSKRLEIMSCFFLSIDAYADDRWGLRTWEFRSLDQWWKGWRSWDFQPVHMSLLHNVYIANCYINKQHFPRQQAILNLGESIRTLTRQKVPSISFASKAYLWEQCSFKALLPLHSDMRLDSHWRSACCTCCMSIGHCIGLGFDVEQDERLGGLKD